MNRTVKAYRKGRHLSVPRARNGLTNEELSRLAEIGLPPLPATRADCPKGPCPHVRCRHHLAVDIHSRGSLTINHPGPTGTDFLSVADQIASGAMDATCSLTVADAGASSMADVAELLNVDEERARQIYHDALGKLRTELGRLGVLGI